MNIIKELEATRKRMIQEINTEIDILIERTESEGIPMKQEESVIFILSNK